MATANKNLSEYDKSRLPSAFSFRFALVRSQWNDLVTSGLYKGAYDTLIDLGAKPENITTIEVPGSMELIYGCRQAAALEPKVDAIIAIGCLIKGETMHFEFVSMAVYHGLSQLNLTLPMPVIACVLTDNNLEQSLARSGGVHGNKGVEAAVTALLMCGRKV
ncbi:MAG: 6,7-dimethyl-8-ribityllumazine synthase [Thermaurantimonas sp.]|uniref:6,7-dimethyl-8-ribityllumazine synthase n=1 Tax=Thermaurantimonas sp. TaxID=2681568 RepID=UPI00391D8AE1